MNLNDNHETSDQSIVIEDLNVQHPESIQGGTAIRILYKANVDF
jgi:hypothetical protein